MRRGGPDRAGGRGCSRGGPAAGGRAWAALAGGPRGVWPWPWRGGPCGLPASFVPFRVEGRNGGGVRVGLRRGDFGRIDARGAGVHACLLNGALRPEPPPLP